MTTRSDLPGLRLLFLGIVALVGVGVVLKFAKAVILPLLIAFFAMVLLSPLVAWLKAKRLPDGLAIPLAMSTIALFFLGLGLAFYLNVGPVLRATPRYKARAKVLMTRGTAQLERMGLKDNLDAVLGKDGNGPEDLIDPGKAMAFLTGGVTTFIDFVGQAVLVLLFLLFMLFEAVRFHEKAELAFGEDSGIFETVTSIGRDVRLYVFWKTVLSLGTGVLTALICAIFGVDFPLFWGILAFGLNYIPNLGSVVASVLPALLCLFQFDNPLAAVGLLVTLVVMQNLLGSLLEPRLIGNSLRISPLLLLISLVFWGWLWGVMGMILAVPIAVTLKVVCLHVPRLKPAAIMLES